MSRHILNPTEPPEFRIINKLMSRYILKPMEPPVLRIRNLKYVSISPRELRRIKKKMYIYKRFLAECEEDLFETLMLKFMYRWISRKRYTTGSFPIYLLESDQLEEDQSEEEVHEFIQELMEEPPLDRRFYEKRMSRYIIVLKPMEPTKLRRMEEDQLEEALKYMQQLMEDPSEKFERMIKKLQELLLENPEFDLYSKRHREQVWEIVEWMASCDYVDVGDVESFSDDSVDDVASLCDDVASFTDSVDMDADVDDAESFTDDCVGVGDVECFSDDDSVVFLSDESVVSLSDDSVGRCGDLPDCYAAVSAKYDIGELRKSISVLAERRKMLKAYEEEHGGASWHSICYPLDQKCISDTGPYIRWELVNVLTEVVCPALLGLMPRGTASAKDKMTHDVVSLLSLGGKRTLITRTGKRVVLERDTFRGKYVLVCCITAPALFASDGFQSLLNLCYELSSKMSDFEMVMAARMNILVDSEETFNHLFSGLPESCLAVPYEDWERRERIWKLLSCGGDAFQCAVYDTKGLFLKSFCADGCKNPYGAEAFPFDKQTVHKVRQGRLQLRKDSLENLLRPYESSPDVVVCEFNGGQGKRLLSEVIENKHVGLLVCCRGNLIPLLHKLFIKCKEEEKKFEIVVLYLPLLSKVKPALFKNSIDVLLRDNKIRGWWCLPFNNSVSLRFWGLTKKYHCNLGFYSDENAEDKLIMVGCDGKILDMYGASVITRHGIDVFPFTRAAVVEKKMRELRDLELEASLLPGEIFHGVHESETIDADELLKGKKIIIYMGKPQKYSVNGRRFNFHGLVSQYKKMKMKSSDGFEVLFVEFPYAGVVPEVDRSRYSAMPWYIHRPCDGKYAPLAEKLEQSFRVQSLVGFEDGHIRSVKILEKLYKSKTPGLCLEETLFGDLYQIFNFDEYMEI